jgi:hypothetical protein
MATRIHSAALHRIAVPAWLLAVVIAAAIAACLVAVIDEAAAPAPVRTQAPIDPTTCVDASVVGHC